jgi:hypothetical protein
LAYNVTKPIVMAVAIVIMFSLIADLLHSQRPRYAAGRTYPIAKDGVVCLTQRGLAKARGQDADAAKKLGCLELATNDHPQVKVIESDSEVVKVMVSAPKLPVDNFQGWTASDNLGPEAAP